MKKIIIIGAAKPGYAQAITQKMISQGVSVLGTYEMEFEQDAQELSKSLPDDLLKLIPLDVSSRKDLVAFVNSINENIDGVIYAQFYFNMENPNQFDHELWDKSIAVNLTAPNFLIHELKNKMNSGSSNIIMTSTEAYRGSYGASAYSASKAAIHNLVKSLANTLGKRNIRINAVPAGWIGGEMDTDEIFNKSRDLTPLSRLGKPEEIAEAVYFLFSSVSSFINGTTMIADGGYLCSDPLAKYEFDDLSTNTNQ
ncbi:MAG: SDR family oxidoreductase [Bacteroidetes bacterium]|jgi:3-oxoacyl-[acyl-carrier protein] reductase|nr:SDR family oxidoreductase [Bacteroidota bacterium]